MGWWTLVAPSVVAYVMCAGMARRLWRVPNSGKCTCLWDHCEWDVCRRGPKCAHCRDDDMQALTMMWPVVCAWRVVNWIVRYAIVIPTTATYRLCAGETLSSADNVEVGRQETGEDNEQADHKSSDSGADSGRSTSTAERVSTHWDGCWQERGHHECAIAEINRLGCAISDGGGA